MSTSEDDNRHNKVINKLQKIFPVDVSVYHKNKILHGEGTFQLKSQLAKESLTSMTSKLLSTTMDPVNDLNINVKNIIETTTQASQNVFYILFIGTWLMILFLTLILFAAIYNPFYLYYFIGLAIIVMVVFILIIYFWTLSIYHDTLNKVSLFKHNIKQLLPLIKNGLYESYCSLGDDPSSL